MNELDWIAKANGGRADTLEEICSDLNIDTSETVSDFQLADDEIIRAKTTFEEQVDATWLEFETAVQKMETADKEYIEVYTINRDEPEMGKAFLGLLEPRHLQTTQYGHGNEVCFDFVVQGDEPYSGPMRHFSFEFRG